MYPGSVNFLPAGAALGLWILLGAWLLVKARKIRDLEGYLQTPAGEDREAPSPRASRRA